MGFPTRKEIEEVLKELEKVEGTLSLSPRATPDEVFRWEIHQRFLVYMRLNKISQVELSRILGIDEAKVSKILHHRLDGFSTDRLMRLYQKLDPKVKYKVS